MNEILAEIKKERDRYVELYFSALARRAEIVKKLRTTKRNDLYEETLRGIDSDIRFWTISASTLDWVISLFDKLSSER